LIFQNLEKLSLGRKILRLNNTISIHFKVWGEKYIKVSDMDEFQFHVKIPGLQTYLIIIFIGIILKIEYN